MGASLTALTTVPIALVKRGASDGTDRSSTNGSNRIELSPEAIGAVGLRHMPVPVISLNGPSSLVSSTVQHKVTTLALIPS